MVSTYTDLLTKGCLCGTDDIAKCPLHGPGDNRGIAAWFKAGMPNGFPMAATCSLCRSDGLMYPSVELDRGEVPAGSCPGPTLVCPSCSHPANERLLAAKCEAAGYALNPSRVFAQVELAA